jgi:hypothetical protein
MVIWFEAGSRFAWLLDELNRCIRQIFGEWVLLAFAEGR